jgi:2-polyprenyl-3-methyl-5-hydroxy-6-metoxy-1,4-benzoquinol methylase
MDYTNYSEWKGWLNEVPFGELQASESERFRMQLDRFSISYKQINALELGFGNGGFMRFLKDNGSVVEGIEVQEELIEAAKRFGFPAHNSVDKATQAPYDLIVAFDVLEHLTLPQLMDFFVHADRLLKSDGVMLFRFPNADSFAGLGAQNGDFTHITSIGQQKLQQLVGPAGFRIDRFESEVIYPRRVMLDTARLLFRQICMKLVGVGNPYFFATNVVTVVKRHSKV